MEHSISGNSDTLSFDIRKFSGGYNESRFDMYFPRKGVQLPIPKTDSFSNTLKGFREGAPSFCEHYWKAYLYSIERHCGEWENRLHAPDADRIPCEMMMLAGVLQVDDKILQASFKRLYGRFIDAKETLISEGELLTVAFALWNPVWTEYTRCKTWREFVAGLNNQFNAQQERKARQEAALAELLTELV